MLNDVVVFSFRLRGADAWKNNPDLVKKYTVQMSQVPEGGRVTQYTGPHAVPYREDDNSGDEAPDYDAEFEKLVSSSGTTATVGGKSKSPKGRKSKLKTSAPKPDGQSRTLETSESNTKSLFKLRILVRPHAGSTAPPKAAGKSAISKAESSREITVEVGSGPFHTAAPLHLAAHIA